MPSNHYERRTPAHAQADATCLSTHSEMASSPSEEDSLELLECARYGELDELMALHQQGIDLNFKDGGGNTGTLEFRVITNVRVIALHRACANGHVDVVKYLIKSGASFCGNESGNTPLHWAVLNKASGIVKLLLRRYDNIDVLAKNDFGKSALSEAFVAQETAVLQQLLEHKSAKQLEPEGEAGEDDPPSEKGEGASSAATKKKKKRRRKKKPEGAADAEPGATGAAEGAKIIQSVTHTMRFAKDGPEVLCREVGTDWTGKVFTTDGR